MMLASAPLGVDSLGIITADVAPSGPVAETAPAWSIGNPVKTSLYLVEIGAVVRPYATIAAIRATEEADYRITEEGIRFADVPAAALLDSPTTLRFGSETFITRPSDSPANQPYEARLLQPLTVQREIPLSPRGARAVQTSYGRIVLRNADRGLDAVFKAYAIDGRTVRVLVVDRGAAYSTAEVIFSGTATGSDFGSGGTIEIGIADNTARMDQPIQTRLFAGTGGLEGGDDAKGKPVPICLGLVRNVSPPLTDFATQVFVVGDGRHHNVVVARDNGVVLGYQGAVLTGIVAATKPPAGRWIQNRSEAAIKLGSQQFGQITCDIEGYVQDGVYWDTAADIALHILRDRFGMALADIDVDAFHALAGERPWRCGVWTGLEVVSFAQVIDALMRSINAWWGPDGDGRITCGLIEEPQGIPGGAFTEGLILEDGVAALPMPSDLSPAVWRWRANWDVNYTVQPQLTVDESGESGVTPELKAYVENPSRVAVAPADGDAAVKDTHILALEPDPIDTLLRRSYEADALAGEWLDLFDGSLRPFSVLIPDDRIRVGLGRCVTLRFPAHNLNYGLLARVVGHRFDAAASRVEYRVIARR